MPCGHGRTGDLGRRGMVQIGTWNLENLFRPEDKGGPRDPAVYEAKLAALAGDIAVTGS